MSWLPVAVLALMLFGMTLRVAPYEAVLEIGLVALLLVATGLATPWRWPMISAACLFLTNHALALWGTDAPVDIVGAAVFGVALLFLLQLSDLGRGMRRASVGAGVTRSLLARLLVFAVMTLIATTAGMAIARPLSAAVPAVLAPLLATAGALGVVTALALAATGAGRRARAGPSP